MEAIDRAKARLDNAEQVYWDQDAEAVNLHLQFAQAAALIDIAESLRLLVQQGER